MKVDRAWISHQAKVLDRVDGASALALLAELDEAEDQNARWLSRMADIREALNQAARRLSAMYGPGQRIAPAGIAAALSEKETT
jgi:hypothetical protein